jgi:putative oxidoreductase
MDSITAVYPPGAEAMSIPSSTRTPSRAPGVIAWIVQILAAMFFTYAAIGKLTGSNAMAVEAFEQIGLGQWLLVTVSVLELLGAIGLLVPALAGLAGLCLAVLAAGAVVVELVVIDGGSPAAALVGLALATIVAVLRRRTILLPFAIARRTLSRA